MTAKIKLNAASGGGSVSLKAPSSTTGNAAVELQLPVADGSADQVLSTNGSGQLAFATVGGGGVPSGGIIIWSGAANAIPTGFVLCDGNNSTPDLRDRFIVGAGNSYSHGATGGSVTATDTANINVSVSGSTSGGGSYSFNAGIFRAAGHTVAASGHQHNFSGSGSGSDTISIDTRSPYYALTFIMKS